MFCQKIKLQLFFLTLVRTMQTKQLFSHRYLGTPYTHASRAQSITSHLAKNSFPYSTFRATGSSVYVLLITALATLLFSFPASLGSPMQRQFFLQKKLPPTAQRNTLSPLPTFFLTRLVHCAQKRRDDSSLTVSTLRTSPQSLSLEVLRIHVSLTVQVLFF